MNNQKTKAPANHVGMDVAALRREHTSEPLDREDLEENPFRQFQRWFEPACDSGIPLPNAMSLATADTENRPALRTVLLKYFDESGFVFFTNLGSTKSAHISNNPGVALLFHWSPFDRQIIIRGLAEKLPTTEVLKYFATRPRGSQIGAWVSHQSHVISARSLLEEKFQEIKRRFKDKEISLPSFWGGYRVTPTAIEFWQGQPDRLHDRFLYSRQDDGSWMIERLQP